MKDVKLIKPTVELKEQYLDMIHEWVRTGEKLVPWVLNFDSSNFQQMINQFEDFSHGIGLPDEYVPHSTYWLVDTQNRILGAVNIRHSLNESLIKRGGHIGYGIRPSERRKGYATEILRLALDKMRYLNVNNVLLTCDKENIGSARTITKNGGVLESEVIEVGVVSQRYWIVLS